MTRQTVTLRNLRFGTRPRRRTATDQSSAQALADIIGSASDRHLA